MEPGPGGLAEPVGAQGLVTGTPGFLRSRRTRRIRPGQIVLARHPGRPEMLLVKRAARRVDGGWWLESDNPGAGAVDSRRFGPVPGPFIEGRVLARYWRPRPG